MDMVDITFLKGPLSIHHQSSLLVINDQQMMKQYYASEQHLFCSPDNTED